MHSHIPIPFPNLHFSNPISFPPTNIETEVEIGFFRLFMFVFIARYEGIDEGTMETKTYYGQIKEIWELDYDSDLQMPIFRC
jgi:hypothetical protein